MQTRSGAEGLPLQVHPSFMHSRGRKMCLYQQAAAGPPEAAAVTCRFEVHHGQAVPLEPAAKSVDWLRDYMLQLLGRLTIRDRSKLPVRPGSESASWRELRRMRWQSMPRYLCSTWSQLIPVSRLNARSSLCICAATIKSNAVVLSNGSGSQV